MYTSNYVKTDILSEEWFFFLKYAEDVKREARKAFKLDPTSEIRLYEKIDIRLGDRDSYEPIPDSKVHATLTEIDVADYSNIVVDFEEDGKWHLGGDR